MKVLEVAKELICFRSETGNNEEIKKTFDYIKNMMSLIGAKVDIFEKKGIAPVIMIRNHNSLDFDALVLGHINVVPADDKMFKPYIKDGKMYGRGSLDMKSFAAVALNSMQYVIENKLPVNFGVILSSDEEKGSKGTKAFLEKYAKIKAEVVLDNDVGGDITKIIAKCKNPVFVKIKAKGKEAHGSRPWDGIDANELMFKVISNIRKIYPAYDLEGKKPRNKWVDTLHFAKIEGGKVANIISDCCEALCDFRLIETSSVEDLIKNNRFDMIFTDQQMPEKTGLQMIEDLCALSPNFTDKIPVIMITSDTREFTVLKAKELKIREYIVKPVSPGLLKKRIHNILHIEESSSHD